MILYLDFTHNCRKEERVRAVSLDVRRRDGVNLSLEWDEGEWDYEDGQTAGRCKGVCIGDDYANGRIGELENITKVILHPDCSDEETEIEGVRILRMEFREGNDWLVYNDINEKNEIL